MATPDLKPKKQSGPMGLKTLLRRSSELRMEPGQAEDMSVNEARSAGVGIMAKILGWKTRDNDAVLNAADDHHSDNLMPLSGINNDIPLTPASELDPLPSRKTPSPLNIGSSSNAEKFGKVNAMGQLYAAMIQGAMAAGSYFSAGLAIGMTGWVSHLTIPLYGTAGLLGVSALGFISLGVRIALSRSAGEEAGQHTPLTPPYKFYRFKEIKTILTSPLAEGPLTYLPDHAARPLKFHNKLRKKMKGFAAYAIQGASHIRYIIVEGITGAKTLLSLGGLVRDMYRGNSEAAGIVKKQRKGMFTLQGINILQAAIGVGTSYIVGALLDAALAKEAAFAVMLAAGVFSIHLFNAYLQTVYSWVKARVRTAVIRDFRVKLFGHILKLPFSFFAREKPSEVAVRLNTDVAQIAVKNVDIPAVLPYYGAMALLAGIMMFRTSWEVTLLVAATMPLLGFLSVVYGNKAEKLNEAQMTRQARMISTAEESLSNVRDVRGFTAEDIEQGRYENQAELFAGTILKKARLADAYTQVMGQLYNSSFYLAVLFIGLFSFISTGAPSIGDTMALVGYAA